MNKIKSEKSMKVHQSLNSNELYRSLRNRIQFSNPNAKIISVISNNKNDGKSQVAYSLAESYGKAGRKVLLIDGNLRHPQLITDRISDEDFGLTSVLKEKDSIDKSILHIESKYIFLLPTSGAEKESTELLEKRMLSIIFEKLKDFYDIIVVDTPAISEGIDSLILSKQCDGAVYVIVENKTKTAELKEYKILLDEANVKIFGVVFRSIS